MTYLDYKRAFIRKHSKADWKVETSGMDQYGTYSKTYLFSDGAILYEVNRPVWEKAETEVEIRGVKVKVTADVKLFETEAWNTDDSTSVKFYEKF